MSATGGGPFRFVVLSEPEGRGIGFGGGRVRVTEVEGTAAGEAGAQAGADAGGSGIARASGYLAERIDRVSRDPDAFNAATIQAASYVHFLLLPIFAMLMMPFWRRRYYVEHLVFGMHVHAFALLPAAVVAALYAASGLDPGGAAARAVTLAGWGIVAGYLYLAIRRVYGGRWWTTALKLGAFLWLYLLCASLVLTGVAVLTALRF